MPAALFMAVARTVLRSTAIHGASPADCLAAVNRILVPQGGGQMYVTLFYGILDTETGILEWTVGGHSAPWILPAEGPTRQLEGPRGFMVGIFDGVAFDSTVVQLRPGDMILAHTDGITDAENRRAEMFGTRRLKELFRSVCEPGVAGVANRIVESVQAFTSGAPQADDITLLAVKFTSPA
jgi:sigma-B regulation protein RsbU (phosphoserine phosphatase)